MLWWAFAQAAAVLSPTFAATPEVTAPHAMVVASSGDGAADAGLELLKRGGTAMDAAMAVAMGQPCHAMGSFVSYAGIITLVYFEASSGKVYSLDGGFNTVRGEKDPLTIPAPAGDLVALSRGGPASKPSGRTAMVPGFFAGVEVAHERFGRRPFSEIVAPGIRCAEQGFALTQYDYDLIRARHEVLDRLPETKVIFRKADGSDYQVGDTFKQPALARTLRAVSRQGARQYIYRGAWGKKFVAAVQREGGFMTLEADRDFGTAPLHWQQWRVTVIVSKPRAHRDGESASYPAAQRHLSCCTRPTCAARLTARSTARCSQRKSTSTDDNPRNQNSEVCGGARAPSAAIGAASSPRSRRCARENGVAATPDTVYYIGSITRAFNAASTFKLVSEGRLHLDESVARRLPNVHLEESVTLRHLLTHTSGISNYSDMIGARERAAGLTPDEVVAIFADRPLEFLPGDAQRLSSSNYFLLGLMIEAVTRMPYAEHMERELHAAGLRNTVYCDTRRLVARRARGYERSAQGLANAPHIDMRVSVAAGALCSTPKHLLPGARTHRYPVRGAGN